MADSPRTGAAATPPGLHPLSVLMARNTASNVAGRLTTLTAAFVATPFLLARLGPSDYGLWILVGSIVGYGWLLDLGIASAVTKFVAEETARGEMAAVRHTVASALWLYAGLGLVTCVAGAVVAVFIGDVFRLAADQRSTAGWLTMLMALTIALGLAFSPTTAVLRGLQRFDLSNLVTVTGALATLAANVLVLVAGGHLIAMVAVGVPVTVACQLWGVWLVRRAAPGLSLGWRQADRGAARRILGFSAPVFALQVASRLQFETDALVIGAFLPLGSLTPYALALRLGGLATIAAGQFTGVILPVASQLSAADDRHRLRSLYLSSMRLTLAMLMPLGLVVIVLAGPILTVWVGRGYAMNAGLVAVLATATILDAVLWPAGYVLQGIGRHRPLAWIALASGAANLMLSIALVQTIGLLGVALGTLIPTSLEAALLVLPLAARELDIRATELVREVILPALAPSVPMVLVLMVLERSVDLTWLPAIVATAVLAVAVYGVLYLSLDAARAERRLCLDLAARLIIRLHVPTRP